MTPAAWQNPGTTDRKRNLGRGNLLVTVLGARYLGRRGSDRRKRRKEK